jgi:peptidoglycan/LPS O-acetylase OafA/YrhL
MARTEHVPALDGLRGLAVLAVMAYHGSSWATGGFLGVDVFFTLSGFLITTVLLRERAASGSVSLRRFFCRRALRLMPALILMLALYVAAALAFDPGRAAMHLGDAALALTYTANVPRALQIARPIYLAPTWSLAVEAHFYLLWPPVLTWLLSRAQSIRKLALGVAALAALGWAGKHAALLGGVPWYRLYYVLDGRADALLLGCALALWQHDRASRSIPRASERERRLLVLASAGVAACWIVLLGSAAFDERANYLWRSTFVAATTALLILAAVRTQGVARVLSLAPLGATGRISYGLYLCHYPIFLLLHRDLGRTLGETLAAGGLLSFAAATGSYWLVERPALRLKAMLA